MGGPQKRGQGSRSSMFVCEACSRLKLVLDWDRGTSRASQISAGKQTGGGIMRQGLVQKEERSSVCKTE